MENFAVSILDFIRSRQLNIAIAGILTIAYLVYQYWDCLFKQEECELKRKQSRVSRSRSRSRSGSPYQLDNKSSWRGRKPHRRCPNCSACNLCDES